MMNESTYLQWAEKARSLRTNNYIASTEFLLQLSLLALGFFLSSTSVIGWFVGQILLGICFWRSFAILHACGHQAFFTSRFANDFIGLLSSVFCFIPYYSWKYIHQEHHKWTGWIDLDPTTRNLTKRPKPFVISILNFCWKFWLPVISLHYIVTVFFKTKSESYKSARAGHLVLTSIALVLLVHGYLIYQLEWNFLRYFALSGFIYLNMGDISLLTQHIHLPLEHSKGEVVLPKKLYQQDQYSHTMLLPPVISRWIVLGFNHHSLHHLFPNMPYYQKLDIDFQGQHTHAWKEWILKAKAMKASALVYAHHGS